MGHQTAASADGRFSGKPLANGNGPTNGNDKNGITALLNSMVKPSPLIHAGAVQNMKFSKKIFNDNREKLKSLLKTYFEKGGTQAMITVVNPQDLKNAMENPESYKNLFVRVGGFTARFVELTKDVQEDILYRTLYS
ncbi:MAG: glycine radical domain-containing protein [Halanaerobiaceae bacterium]